MSSLLRPWAAAPTFSGASHGNAVKGFRLGDHVGEHAEDPTEASTVPRNFPSTVRPFDPYQPNGGTVVAVAGKGYCIVASDTRFGLGYAVPARNVSRIMKMTDKVVLATAGMQADMATLHKVLRARLVAYEHNHNKQMSLTAASQMLSIVLYYKRFFPYYTFNVLGGLDENGDGWVYGYDAVGSHEKVQTTCSGTGQYLVQPVLDNQIESKQRYGYPKQMFSMDEALELVKDAFSSAGERDIYTGDFVEICKITQAGTEVEMFELKKD